jgi:16S rRNA processing protein RimM
VRRAVGLRGEIEVEPLTDRPERFRAGVELLVGGRRRAVEQARHGPHGITLKLAGVDGRTEAERLPGQYLEVDRAEVEALPPGSYYHWQLIGLDVVKPDGSRLGRVVDVQPYPANDVYVVGEGGAEMLVPALREVVREVDLEAGRMVIDLPAEEEVR